jgi:hypothetical protein
MRGKGEHLLDLILNLMAGTVVAVKSEANDGVVVS